MKIVYCGFGRAGLECFYQLLTHFNIDNKNIIVFTHDTDENKEFVKHLKNNNIEFYFGSVNKYYDVLLEFEPQYLISVYYRYIIKPNILELVKYRAMNLHPSILPSYRGTKSSVWALINGEKETGISFHYMNKNIDDGKLILQKKIKISENDTAYSLYNKLISLFVRSFAVAFEKLLNGFEGFEQKGEISYYKRELPFGGVRKLSDITLLEAQQFIKAMYYPPFKGASFIITDGSIVEINKIKELNAYIDLFRIVE